MACISRLPRTLVEVVACLMFLLGGILLLRGAGKADEEEAETEAEFGAKAAGQVVGWRVVTLSFTVLFLAEWGDLSQILTASLVVRYDDPLSVFVGAFLALVVVSGLAAALGRTLLTRMRLSTLRRIGGGRLPGARRLHRARDRRRALTSASASASPSTPSSAPRPGDPPQQHERGERPERRRRSAAPGPAARASRGG